MWEQEHTQQLQKKSYTLLVVYWQTCPLQAWPHYSYCRELRVLYGGMSANDLNHTAITSFPQIDNIGMHYPN